MKFKKILLSACLAAAVNYLPAQTLFTYGTHAVSKKDFLEAYNKNPDTTGNRRENLKQYLDLYINFRLKLQAAYDEKASTNEELKSEADNFKNQLTENYINQQANISKLMQEAFLHSQKDILLQEVFVQFPSSADTAAAYTQITKAYQELKAGKDFDDVAGDFSSDSSIKKQKGTVGYITAFTLPNTIENIVYSLKPGEYSTIYKSNIGYHIFKNAGEKPAMGRRKVEQLLFSTPQFFTYKEIENKKKVADSVYNLLMAGTSFTALLPVYGHNFYDYQSANSIEVAVGEYGPAFEDAVFSLKNAGDISKPFKTEYGYNIIKLDEIMPVAANENDVNYAAYLQTQIQNDGRLDAAKKNLIEKWLPLCGYKAAAYNQQNLWSYTDSALITADSLPAFYKGLKPQTSLFQFTKEKETVKDWVAYLHFSNVASGAQNNYEKLMHNFTRYACNNYYRKHIEDFDTSAAEQLKEFNDANMLFYVMDKYVWSKASNDSAGLKQYYETHKNDYTWKKSETALIISSPEKKLADSIADKIKANPENWRKIIEPYGNSVYADSSRFEQTDLPVKQPVTAEAGFQTQPESNEAGDSYTFIHVLKVFANEEPRTFDEAKGLVINDYQQELEKEWLKKLKEIYPVKINNIIFNTMQ